MEMKKDVPNDYQSMEHEVEKLKKKIVLLNSEKENLLIKIEMLQEELNELRTLYVNTVDYATMLENDLEMKIKKLTDHEIENIPLEDSNSDIRKKLATEIQKNYELNTMISNLNDQLDQLRFIYSNSIEHSTTIENELDEKYEEEKTKSITDPLTGAYNRLGFQEQLSTQILNHEKNETPYSLIMFDIDHFKNINDSYGHDIGDHVLSEIASVTMTEIRKEDSLFRWGGEEFIITLPGLNKDKAFALAERIREKMSTRNYEEVGTVSCSFGVSEMYNEEDINEVILRADKALYQSKNNGRNQVSAI